MRRWLGVSSHASPFFFSCASVHTIVPKIPLCQRKRSSTWNEPSSPFDLVKRCSQRTHAIVLIVFGSVACSMIHNGSVIQFAFCTLWLLCYRAAFCWHKKLDVVKRQLLIKVHSVGILRLTTIWTEQIVYSIVGLEGVVLRSLVARSWTWIQGVQFGPWDGWMVEGLMQLCLSG
jgi:hypothetical protein